MTIYRERPLAMRAVLRGPGGPVVKAMRELEVDAYRQARLVTAERLNRRTGAYENAFDAELRDTPLGPRMRLSNDDRKAQWLELGTRPHPITPRAPRRYLRFMSRGRVVYARRVMHPGTRPYRILDTALRRIMRRYL